MKIKLPDFESSHVVVLGDLMLDRYWHGDTSRISPEAPVPVVRVDKAEERPGAAGNVALNIASLGARVSLFGLTGDDEASHSLLELLQSAGVECHFEKLKSNPTVTKLRVLSRHQQLIRLDFEDGFKNHNAQNLVNQFKRQLSRNKVVILSDYGKGTLRDVRDLIALARDAEAFILVDPKGSDFERYRGATMITPNLSEFETVVGRCDSDEELVHKGDTLIDQLNLRALLITRSERGMTLVQRGQSAIHLPTRAREVYDVTGAGDTVISVFAATVAAGEKLSDAVVLANLAAGIVVSKLGTASVTTHELKMAMHDGQMVEQGIIDESSLVQLMQEARDHGQKLVMTNGCFDLLHPGHITYLQQARRLGDRLIVAVNDDRSVRRVKGEKRPINTLERRMAVLVALACVDWVVPFSEDTPERIVSRLLPDVLVKGGDYKPQDVAGGDVVVNNGGEVVILDYIADHSTSEIINSILNS